MKIANFVLQLLLILSFALLILWMEGTNETDISIYELWLMMAGTIQSIGTIYKNIKFKFQYRGYLIHLIVSLVYFGVYFYLLNYTEYSLYAEKGIFFFWIPVPFMLACFYTYCAYNEISKRRKKLLEI